MSDVSLARQSSAHNPDMAATTMPRIRWLQLVMGIACMAMIANLQYGWTLDAAIAAVEATT